MNQGTAGAEKRGAIGAEGRLREGYPSRANYGVWQCYVSSPMEYGPEPRPILVNVYFESQFCGSCDEHFRKLAWHFVADRIANCYPKSNKYR